MSKSQSDLIHIAHVVPAVRIGGVLRHLEMLSSLPTGTYTHSLISIFDLDEPQALRALDIETNRLRIPLSAWLKEDWIATLLRGILEGRAVRLVHSYHPFSDYYSVPAARCSRIPCIRSVHGFAQVSWSNPFDRATVKENWTPIEIQKQLALNNDVHKTLVVSKLLGERLLEYGFPPEKITLLYPGVAANVETDWMREEDTSKPRTAVIGFLHRLDPMKRPELLPSLVEELTRAGITAQIVLPSAGFGGLSFKQRIEASGLVGSFLFLCPVPQIWRQVPPLDLMLVLSATEGLPLVILESMARGVPVVATRVGGIPEIISHGVTGFLLESVHPQYVANFLVNVLRDRAARIKVAVQARALVRSQFSVERYIESLDVVYRSVVHA